MANSFPYKTPPSSVCAGSRFGQLTALETVHGAQNPIRCRCDCGREIRLSRIRYLNGGKGYQPRSCGCTLGHIRHGKSKTAEYRIWSGIITRCEDAASHAYSSYGGRGITMCDRWRMGFESFLADMGPRPSSRHSVERLDNDGPYSPENCRWATPLDQGRNKRNNRLIAVRGVSKTISEWADVSGLSGSAIKQRLDLGWLPEDAVTMPAKERVKYKRRKATEASQ
jgi:hypothetical protein